MDTKTIEQYYSLVDAGETGELLKLFSDNATYIRAGKNLSGKSELEKFYTSERKLIGKHTIHSIKDLGGYVVVEGEFNGTNSNQDVIAIPFADIFEIKNNLIEKRQTYLGLMSQLIE